MKTTSMLFLMSATILLQTPMVFAGRISKVGNQVFDEMVKTLTDPKPIYNKYHFTNKTGSVKTIGIEGGHKFDLPVNSTAVVKNAENSIDIVEVQVTQTGEAGAVFKTWWHIDKKTGQKKLKYYDDAQIRYLFPEVPDQTSFYIINESLAIVKPITRIPFSVSNIAKISRSKDSSPSIKELIIETTDGKVYKLIHDANARTGPNGAPTLYARITQVQNQVPAVGFKRPALRNATN